jgi:anti-sigma regulatory factor (Ser/Thr protein kinase)
MTSPAAVSTSTVPAIDGWDLRGFQRGRWQLYQHLELGAVLTGPGCGRSWIRTVLREWGAEAAADLAELIASELLTNAVAASVRCGATAVHLYLASDHRSLLIMVRDFAPGTPARRRLSTDEDSGRGLQIVGELAGQHGWQPPPDGGPGKVVWVLLTIPEGRGPERLRPDGL